MRSMLMAPIGRPSRSPIANPIAIGRPVAPPPSFDDSELRRRLRALEGRPIPQFDPTALQQGIAGLQDQFANFRQFDPTNLQSQIGGLQDRLANFRQFDDSALRRRLQALEGREMPRFDDTALRNRLQALEGREIPQFDPSQLQAGIQGLSDRISNIPQFDPSALQNRLSALENRQAPTFNPEDFREQFLNIARQGIDIPQPTPAFDPTRLQNRLRALENREMPQFDPSRLQERLSALENVQPVTPTPAFDPSGLIARLDDFETRLGAMQQPLPIQPPGDLNLDIKEDAPDIRDLAKELPEGGTIFDRLPVQKPTPPMSIERLGDERLIDAPVGNMQMGEGVPFTPPTTPVSDVRLPISGNLTIPEQRPVPPISIGGPGGGRDDLVFAGGSRTFDERGETFVPPSVGGIGLPEEDLSNITDEEIRRRAQQTPSVGMLSFEEEQERILDIQRELSRKRNEQRAQKGLPAYEDRIIEGLVPTGSVVEPTPDLVATATVDPVTPSPTETIPTPPGSVDPIIMGQTADEVVTDPLIRALYFGTTDQPGFFNQLQQVGANLLGAQAPGTEYDPSMTEKFFNPFEDRVVQQTIEDVLKAGEQRDIAQRAQDIGRGGLSAFGSRARLTADERQEALGRGLGQALAGIRQSGFSEAQRTGLSEFDRQYGRDISQLYRPLDVLRGIGGLLPGYTQATSRIGTTYGMPGDPTALGLGAALNTYASLAPQTGSAFDAYMNTQKGQS